MCCVCLHKEGPVELVRIRGESQERTHSAPPQRRWQDSGTPPPVNLQHLPEKRSSLKPTRSLAF